MGVSVVYGTGTRDSRGLEISSVWESGSATRQSSAIGPDAGMGARISVQTNSCSAPRAVVKRQARSIDRVAVDMD